MKMSESSRAVDKKLQVKNYLKKKIKLIPEIKNEFIYGKQTEYDKDHNVVGIKDEPSPYCVGSLNKGYSLELSEQIFDSMESFAKYCFNKAHKLNVWA